MKLRDMLKLLRDCNYMVLDLDSGLRTVYIRSWDAGHPQLRTLLDKVVKAVFPVASAVPNSTMGTLVLEVANA